jgi:hypothetical protein
MLTHSSVTLFEDEYWVCKSSLDRILDQQLEYIELNLSKTHLLNWHYRMFGIHTITVSPLPPRSRLVFPRASQQAREMQAYNMKLALSWKDVTDAPNFITVDSLAYPSNLYVAEIEGANGKKVQLASPLTSSRPSAVSLSVSAASSVSISL